MRTRDAYQNKPVILSHTPESIRPPITSEIIKCDSCNKGGVSLASCDNSLFPGGEERQEIVLSASLRWSGEGTWVEE